MRRHRSRRRRRPGPLVAPCIKVRLGLHAAQVEGAYASLLFRGNGYGVVVYAERAIRCRKEKETMFNQQHCG